MDAPQHQPLDLVRVALGPSQGVFVGVAATIGSAHVLTRIPGRFDELPSPYAGLIGFVATVLALLLFPTIPFGYCEWRARRVLSAARVLQHEASRSGLDLCVRQLQLAGPGARVAPQRLIICDGRLWIDGTWWSAHLVTVHHDLISRWRRGVPITVAGHPVRLSVLSGEDDSACMAVSGALAVDRTLAATIDAALHAPTPAPAPLAHGETY